MFVESRKRSFETNICGVDFEVFNKKGGVRFRYFAVARDFSEG